MRLLPLTVVTVFAVVVVVCARVCARACWLGIVTSIPGYAGCGQSHLDGRVDALALFEQDTSRKASTTADRLSSEEEQLRIKEEHVAKVERLVKEEQTQVRELGWLLSLPEQYAVVVCVGLEAMGQCCDLGGALMDWTCAVGMPGGEDD